MILEKVKEAATYGWYNRNNKDKISFIFNKKIEDLYIYI